MCLSESTWPAYFEFVGGLEDYTGDEDYGSTLGYVIDELYSRGNTLIIHLDWKQDVRTPSIMAAAASEENFGKRIALPQQDDYGPRASVSYDGVFRDFDEALRAEGLQLSFIDTESDEYVAVVHEVADVEAVASAVEKIGYDRLDASARQISGAT